MKPYLLTLSSDTKNINRFLSSIKGNFEHIAIQFKPYTKLLKTSYAYDMAYPGNLKKYFFTPRNLDKNRYIIYSDTDDVIFQKEFNINFDYDFYLGAENIIHNDTIWRDYINKYSLFELLRYKEVFNAGFFITKVSIFYKLIDFMLNFKEFINGNFDQLLFNLFLNKNPEFSKVIDISLICPLYANFDKKLCNKDDNGLWKTKNGKIISVIHENGIKKRL